MLEGLIKFSLKNKLIVILFTLTVLLFGLYSLTQIPIGAVPDITNNQVQVITTSRNLSTQDVEQFITYPVELEMANLPGVKEIRSVSKFGLSVVTIVFTDKMGTYLPRQLIAEKIKVAETKIPQGFGSPEMGPITTGLGEIYQYILDVKPGYDSLYSVMDLRTIQDWIVKRQLSGIPGVVEVNTWGGFLKQYEVALDPEKLQSMNITAIEVYNALEANNSIAGGGYIEKENESYFIRGEGLAKSLGDIEKIIVKNVDGIPIFVKDIALVHFGSATRFGAITGNGQGEKVLGQVMMLKHANSKKVIDAVKKRVEEVQKNLPEGVYINAFLERSDLIKKTTLTVAENLIFGFLIVMFVVILLLGNFRSGLIIATVIPLSLLFTISLMNIFHIDANLMSLGAIDFGIIIDGAVIIVEFIAFQITLNYRELSTLEGRQKQKLIDKITLNSTNKMMNSAVFGQLIIIIVFIPILSLSGVEGKMFKPMAMTFSFALIGAMMMGLSYVPVISSMFIKPGKKEQNFSASFMNWLKKLYIPSIRYALNHKVLTLGLSLFLLISSIFVFSRMGGEFVPTLDEGDFVIQPVLKTGTSLSKTIELVTRMENILLDNFPEVDQVISRIGAAEVPTDPMSMEETDVIIKLKPIKEWSSGNTKDELADRLKEALSVIPGVDYEFTQPIEMRFNELITGVRADVAIKIFGEDLSLLSQKAREIKALIENVDGASDIIVEKIEGLPQMSVKYDRDKLAKYGVSVEQLNQIVSLAFAGMTAGSIFEGEKRFDLVVRLHKDFRKDIRNLQKLYVNLPNGESVPLTEMADIQYTKGPAKISRDNTKRRIVVGINVRNRDLESVVTDVQKLINSNIKLPPGYSISFGGQFENLRSAKKRLMLAVPVALLLIFIMLHFAFKSAKEAAMVYTAIPLSAVGGVALLWIRGMPFSISAGIGFIALFGIAVLNGIVLVEYFKELKTEGMKNINDLIIKGTTERLRPILLTASAAALGFLPMAISTSAGAEVQKPLATVVIGGLITSTFLTLIVLPVLYAVYDKTRKKGKKAPSIIISALLFILVPLGAIGQTSEPTPISLEEALEIALQNNKSLIADSLSVVQSENFIPSAVNLDKTQAYYNYDENNISENGYPIKVWGIQQNLQFPTVYSAQKNVLRNISLMQQSKFEINKRILKKDVSKIYFQIIYLQNKVKIYALLDSLNLRLVKATNLRYDLGGNNYLEKLTSLSYQQRISTEWQQIKDEVRIAYKEFAKLTGSQTHYIVEENQLEKLDLPVKNLDENPGLQYYQNAIELADATKKLQKNKLLPDLHLEYFQGKNKYANAKLYQGFSVGIAVPLFFGSQKAKIKASSIGVEIINNQSLYFQEKLNIRYEQLLAQLRKYQEALSFYEKSGKYLAREIYNTATKSFETGEIDFFKYIISIRNAKELELSHLDNLNNYNQTIIELKYIVL